MVLDEDIDQEQDSVTSRLWRITFCFVLREFFPDRYLIPVSPQWFQLWLSLGNRCGIARSV